MIPNDNQTQRISIMLKDKMSTYFGMSPPTCTSYLHSPYLVITLKNILSPLESSLINQGEMFLVEKIRDVIMKPLLEELEDQLKQTMAFQVERWYYDWKYGANQGIIMAKEEKGFMSDVANSAHTFAEIVVDCYTEIHTEPERVKVMEVHQHAFLLACSGVLFDIEKMLFKQGHEKLLRKRENPRRASFLHRLSQRLGWDYEHTFDHVSVLWDYEQDTALIYLEILKAS
ncbi:Na-translocating system protein MpsC family protein [Bacillus horti]|nr:Na-translocating system protein MpsC family protein [Bacillus horti]